MPLRSLTVLSAVLLFHSLSSLAVADSKPTTLETQNLERALTAMGCRGGRMEKEENGTYEVEDTKCPEGKFDIEFDSHFAVIEKDRD